MSRNREGVSMNNTICFTNSEIKNIRECLAHIDHTIAKASNRTVYNKPEPISPEDLHKIFRDQFGFGKLR